MGTRPEAIKMAPVRAALGERSDEVETRLALTGQHSTLVSGALETFRLTPDYDLEIMTEGQTLYGVAVGCLEGLGQVVREFGPDMVLVQGDTATVCFGAFVAFFEHTRVGHVEAGLRSRDKWAPFPEEVFRRVTDTLADHCFAPTRHARDNLAAEGVLTERIHLTGNTVVDALQSVASRNPPVRDAVMRSIAEGPRRLVLMTVHRRESFGEPIREVFRGVRDLVEAEEDIEVFYPVHPNPKVSTPAFDELSGHPRIHLGEPVSYQDLVWALQHSDLVLTDSGGIQEEAPTFGTPVLVLRDVTERPEGVDAGVAELVGTDRALIVERSRALLAGSRDRETISNPYGDGRAGERIADIVISDLTGRSRLTTDWSGR